MLNKLRAAIERCGEMEGISVEVRALYFPLTTYTGVEGQGFQGGLPFSVSPNEDYVVQAKVAVEAAVGHKIKCKSASYGADAGHYSYKGVKCLLYSPVEVKLCHTNCDSIDIEMMAEATVGTLAIVDTLCNNPK